MTYKLNRNDPLREQLKREREIKAELLDACQAVMAQFDAGTLCRNTDSDGLSDWAIRATPALLALAKMIDAIAKAESVLPARPSGGA